MTRRSGFVSGGALVLSSVIVAACGGEGAIAAAPITTSVRASGWQAGPVFPSPRDHHATFVNEGKNGAFLYVVGGAKGNDFLADGFRAPIVQARGGALGAWEKVTSLPGPRAGAGVVMDGHHVVLAGGKTTTGKVTSDSVVLGTVGDDGQIAWRDGPPLPEPRFHLTCALVHGVVFAIGGLGAEFHSTSTIFSAKLASDGTLGPWQKTRGLPSPRSHHASFVHDGKLYVAGGLHGDPTDDAHVRKLDEVLVAEARADGSIGEWTTLAPLPSARATHAATVDGDRVVLFGGLEEDVTDHVSMAAFTSSGALGPWQPLAPMPRKRAHVHQVPIFDGVAYAVSGNGGDHVAIDDVSYFRLP